MKKEIEHTSKNPMSWILEATFCKLLLNTSRRFVYPFAPALSRGLGVPLSAITQLIAINQATSLVGPFFAPLGDRYGYRVMMLTGMGLLSAGMIAVAMVPTYSMLMASLILAGLGKILFDPAIQAYVGENIPYEKRGLYVGILEIAWSGSTMIGIPLIGFLIGKMGWRAPFLLIGLLSMAAGVILWRTFPEERIKAGLSPAYAGGGKLLSSSISFLKNRHVMGMLGYSFFTSIASDMVFVMYGAWLETSFGLSLIALGIGTSVIGFSEITGEGATALFSDRIGFKKAVITGVTASLICNMLLPFCGNSLPMALAGLYFIFLTFEFTLVTSLGICSELVPGARATMMSIFWATGGLGRVVGASVGGPVWLSMGIGGTAAMASISTALALACLLYGLWGWRRSSRLI